MDYRSRHADRVDYYSMIVARRGKLGARGRTTALRSDIPDGKLVALVDDALAGHVPPSRQPSENTTEVAALAAELGYSDQAHLVRDFTDAVGEAPQRYANRVRKLPDA
jgi:AraC-like DNA-binding protein